MATYMQAPTIAWWQTIFDWLDQHNGFVTALATVALATLTAYLAFGNRKLLQASTAATKAAQEEAALTREAMQLEWRPILTCFPWKILGQPSPVPVEVRLVKNVGRGPALNVRLLSRVNTDPRAPWSVSAPFGLGAGEATSDLEWEEIVSQLNDAARPPNEVWGGPDVYDALFCQDQAGVLYRFKVPEPIPDIWPRNGPKEPWVEWLSTRVGDSL